MYACKEEIFLNIYFIFYIIGVCVLMSMYASEAPLIDQNNWVP